ncbi:PleD family two-component system response regulator [Acidisphaera sp. L21]|uniref:PleD family two-component system response regulator n=1 Tax=Acidisphaera sp. L21 TaxID=1641851 RepID=UPI00131D55DA|nr:PleD family two-component system response regulator [Acidisphaera sp. L21]
MTARILIVDDVPVNTKLLQAKLVAEYYQVEIAHSGADAIRLAHSWQPDLILLDVVMPEMDGYQTCRRLKSDNQTVHIPVVMVTALADPTERLQGLEVGADDFLTKPLDYDTLLARVRGLVRLKRLLDEWRVRSETAHALGLSNGPWTEFSVAGARALVVDDLDIGALGIQDALSREGIVPTRARSEAEALEICGQINFDLIVLSLSIAGNDPLRLASRLRAERATQEIPLLLVAEFEQRDRLLRGFDLGANDWVTRPVDDNELRVRARNQIRRKFYQDRLRADLSHALELALTDPLTGLYNQRYLTRHLASLIAAEPAALVALMIDIDHFKSVNDRWGHAAGDTLLKQVADTLRSRTRVFDSLARYGGEEFVVIMSGTSADEATRAAERLRLAIQNMEFYPEAHSQHRLTISIGLSRSTRVGVTSEELLGAADRALYRAKHQGRNRVEVELVDN